GMVDGPARWSGFIFSAAGECPIGRGDDERGRSSGSRESSSPGVSRSHGTYSRRVRRWAGAGGANSWRRNSRGSRIGVFSGGCDSGARVAGKNLMFSRAYKMAVTLPPLVWVAVFLLMPYLLMFCYSFWSVSTAQTIVHSWSLDNYGQLFQVSVYWQTLLRSMWIAA